MKKSKFVLGLTGRVGSGKSFACSYLRAHTKITLLDLDEIGHQLLADTEIKLILHDCFGASIFSSSGEIDRKKLGYLVFSSASAIPMGQLNAVMHPAIFHRTVTLLKSIKSGVVVIAGALLDEIGLKPLCDTTWVIDAPDSKIMAKNREQFIKVSPYQRSRKAYLKLADQIIPNLFTPEFGPTLLQHLYDKLPSHVRLN